MKSVEKFSMDSQAKKENDSMELFSPYQTQPKIHSNFLRRIFMYIKKMEIRCQEQESEPLPTGVFEISGEPAIIINGVPDIPPREDSADHRDNTMTTNTTNYTKSQQSTSFGVWLERRKVRKKFGEQFYTGTVTKFDKKLGWHRVVYEDGDFEDLTWDELKEILLPLDITIPLKTMALKIIKKREKADVGSGKASSRSKTPRAKNAGKNGKGNTVTP